LLTITNIIIAFTVLVSILAFNDNEQKYKLIYSPYAVKHHNKWWLVFSHGLIHADYSHLFFNMFVLYSFGNGVEQTFLYLYGMAQGSAYYIVLYVAGLAAASLPALKKHGDDLNYMSLGASGAVSAVFMVYIVYYPLNELQIIFLPGVPIPAIIMGVLYFAYETYANKHQRTNIAHDAHLAGFIFGIIFIFLISPKQYLNMWEQISNAVF